MPLRPDIVVTRADSPDVLLVVEVTGNVADQNGAEGAPAARRWRFRLRPTVPGLMHVDLIMS